MKIVILLLTFSLMSLAQASSTFFVEGITGKALAKSYDWTAGHGMVIVNKRNVEKKSFFLSQNDVETSWVSAFGSVTFNQYGTEFPNGGINEKGLVVESVGLDETQFSQVDNRDALGMFQWIQYQLDNFENTREVIQNLSEIRIVDSFKKIHFLICDSSKECIVIEILNGQVISHANAKVLTNNNFVQSTEHLKLFKGFGGNLPIPTDNSSLSRFVRISDALVNFRNGQRNNVIESSFTMLNSVRYNLNSDTKTSVWNIVYDLEHSRIHFVHTLVGKKKYLNLNDVDFSCLMPRLIYNVEAHQGADNISQDLLAYKKSFNQRIVQASLKDFANQLPPETIKKMVELPETFICKE